MKKLTALILALALVFCLCACGGGGNTTPQNNSSNTVVPKWPTGKINYLIPNQVGTQTDIGCRIILDYIHEVTGVDVIPENNDAGGGAVLSRTLKEAAPDGLTLMSINSSCILNFYKGTWTYNVAKEGITPICGHTQRETLAGSWIMTQPDKPYKTFEELVDYVKAHPGEVSAAAAAGSNMELKFRQCLIVAGIEDKVRWVSTSFSDAIVGLIGNTIDLVIGAEGDSYPYVKDGKAIPLITCTIDSYDPSGVFKDADLEYVKTIPTLTDVFKDRDKDALFENRTFIAGPAGMDPALVKQIADCINDIYNNAPIMERIHGLKGTDFYTWTSEELQQYLKDADAKIAKMMGK